VKNHTPSDAQSALEAKLAGAMWFEALAQITAGFVHDVNNSMAGVLSLSEICLQKLEQAQDLREELTLIKEGAKKSGELLRALMQMRFDQPGKIDFHDINAVTAECVELLRRVLKRRLELEVKLAPGPLPVKTDGLALRKTIFFLALNAADAITTGGKITFATNRLAQAPVVQFGKLHPKRSQVELTVTDTGPRREISALASAALPQLTGSKVADDAQLRLWLIKRFLQTAHGGLSATTSEASGNTYHLILPRAEL
jgi:signal transduction histidine kinase